MPENTTAELWLYGVVGGYWFGFDAEYVASVLANLGGVDLTVRLHSPGGSASEGVAISNLLANYPGHTTVVVDGLAASAASLIALGGDEVVMGPGAQFFIHEPWIAMLGNADELTDEAAFLDGQAQNLAGVYAHHAGGTADDWRAVMRAKPDGTWFDGPSAIAAGLAARVGTIASSSTPPAIASDPADDDAEGIAARARDLTMLHPAALALAASIEHRPVRTNQEEPMPTAADAAPVAAAPVAAPAAAPDPVPAAGLSAAMASPPAARPTRDPAAARRVVASQIAEAMRGASDASQVNAALTDITPPATGTEDLFPRPAWIGELWSPEAPQRAIVNAIGVSPLTAMKMQGWKWGTKPEVGPYAGNKTEIPSGPATVVPAEAEAQRIAGGWDLDRIYVDFNTGFVEAFMAAATQDYRKKSQTYFIDGHDAVVGPPAVPAAEGFLADATPLGEQADVIAAVNAVVTFLLANGANVSFLAMGTTAYTEFLNLTGDAAPWWLQKQGVFNFGTGVNLDGLTIATDPALDPLAVVGGDRAAVSLWETGPINVQAVNIPNGGIDLALFGYWAQLVHDAKGLASATIPAVVPLAARSAKAKS